MAGVLAAEWLTSYSWEQLLICKPAAADVVQTLLEHSVL
jgi:hypothetical protein